MVVEHDADSDDEEDHDQEAEGAEQLVEDAANVVVAGSVLLLLLCTFFITHGERILDRVLVAARAVDTVSSIPSTQYKQDGF